jgi:hypothetical protein
MNTIGTVLRIDAAMRGNKIIYWLGRIPLVRRLVSDTLYDAPEGKLAFSGVLWAGRAVKEFVCKFLYVALALVLPVYLLLGLDWNGDKSAGFGPFCWLLLIMSFGLGTLLRPKATEPSQLKYTCVRMMGMNAALFENLTIGVHQVSMFVTFTPALVAACAFLGQPAWVGLLLSLELALMRMVGEWFHVWVYGRTGVALGANGMYLVFLSTGGLVAAYLPLVLTDGTISAQWLKSPFALGVLILAAMPATVGLVWYPNYYRLVMDTSRPELVSTEVARQKTASAKFSDVQLKESDLTAEGESRLTGWPYLQALFFRRHSRMLYKPVKITLAILGGITVISGVFLLIFRGEETAEVFSLVPRCLPYCVFFLYCMDSSILGTRICKAMFYNCDLALLKYGWYRQPDVILKNFVLRFTRLCGVNLVLSGAVCVMFSVMTLCAGGKPDMVEYIVFMAALLCLGVFFAVHSLGMYYLFQPYTSDLQVKNPFFNIINMVVYMLCYACIQIRSTPSWFALLVLVVTVVYSAVILFLVWRRAPRTFRVK